VWHFSPPLCLSPFDQFEEGLSASRVDSFRVKLLFQMFFCGKEVQRIEHFVGQRISERIHSSAYCADWNKVGPDRQLCSAQGPEGPQRTYTRTGSNNARTPVTISGCRRQISSKMATARTPGAASNIGTISLSHAPASGSVGGARGAFFLRR
jgi:hypothetical protein